jgi:hypothetical protein
MKRFLSKMYLILIFAPAACFTASAADVAKFNCALPTALRVPFTDADTATTSLERAFCAMYDLAFAQANAELGQFKEQYPENPLGPVAEAASVLFAVFEEHKILQTEFFSDERYNKRAKIVPDPAVRQQFEAALHQAEGVATKALAHDPRDENALFALTLVYGLRADYAALLDHQDFAALRFSNKGNEYARRLLAVSPSYYDAYVATGIQQYLVGLKPAPVRWALSVGGIKGNRDQGIRDLELAATKGHYLAPFARVLLAIAHLRKREIGPAVDLLVSLRQEFPDNSLFSAELARLPHAPNNPLITPATSSSLSSADEEQGEGFIQ